MNLSSTAVCNPVVRQLRIHEHPHLREGLMARELHALARGINAPAKNSNLKRDAMLKLASIIGVTVPSRFACEACELVSNAVRAGCLPIWRTQAFNHAVVFVRGNRLIAETFDFVASGVGLIDEFVEVPK